MSRRLGLLLLCLALACGGGSMKTKKGEPQTAREKMLAEQKANPEDKDDSDAGKKWNSWRFQGDRKDCFFIVGKKCFKTENAACQAARCKSPTKCTTAGAGPASLKCINPKKG